MSWKSLCDRGEEKNPLQIENYKMLLISGDPVIWGMLAYTVLGERFLNLASLVTEKEAMKSLGDFAGSIDHIWLCFSNLFVRLL